MTDSTRHTITARLWFNVNSGGAEDRLSLKAEIAYSADSDGTGFTLIDARIVENDDHLNLSDADLRDAAQCWLDDEGYDAACQHAERAPA
jgi:hypothetical protein